MDIWYPGSAAGPAVANLLFGDAVPGGKLPFTWIRDAAQAPNYYAQLISHAPAGADKRYWNGSSSPTYPFGYGLSYTTFQYSNLKVGQASYTVGRPVDVAVDVRNTGNRMGDEIAQLYIHQRYGTSVRPVRELKGFQRVTLRPGETRTLHFTLTPDELRYWSDATHSWVQDATAFDVWAGGDEHATLGAQFITTK
jgi:beta-glucosidase